MTVNRQRTGRINEPCPNGESWCDGPVAAFDGDADLPCLKCWHEAHSGWIYAIGAYVAEREEADDD